jgi:guanylate kinase
MKSRLILVGKAAAGKDHARRICEQWLGMPYQVSYTTRPPRDAEQDGKDYFFVTDEQFIEKIDADEWYEFVTFNGWYYGTTKEQFYTKGSVFIMTPSGLSHLSEEDREESLVIYFDIDEETRKNRMYERAGNADSVERRLLADREDFKDFNNYDIKIDNHKFYITDIAEIVRKRMGGKLVQIVSPN